MSLASSTYLRSANQRYETRLSEGGVSLLKLLAFSQVVSLGDQPQQIPKICNRFNGNNDSYHR
jgi:hypothetical protein